MMMPHAFPNGRLGSTWKFRMGRARTQVGVTARRARTLVQPKCCLSPDDSRDASGGEPLKRTPHPETAAGGSSSSSGGAAESSSSIPDTLPYLGSQSDWREFRAKLVSQARGQQAEAGQEWAHVIPKPERGALLLAHPQLFQVTQTYFHRAAILLLEHGDKGSYGLILNRPSSRLLRDVPLSCPQPQFWECRLNSGGDVGQGEVQMLHPYGQLAGAVEVVRGVYAGGMEAARQAADAGWAQPRDFRWFNGYAGWAPGQLDMECRRGVWFTAAASPQLLLREVEPGGGPEYWHRVMGLLGDSYAELSQAVRKHDELPDPS